MVASQIYLYFRDLVPSPWSQIWTQTAEQRVRCFYVPNCEDMLLVSKAKKLVRQHVKPLPDEMVKLGAEFQKSGGEGLMNEFWLSAKFYARLFEGARVLLEQQNAGDDGVETRSLEYVAHADCNARCQQLNRTRFRIGSPLLARFGPPWHLYCLCQLRPSELEPSEPEIDAMPEDDDHWCSPVDLLIWLGVRKFAPPAPSAQKVDVKPLASAPVEVKPAFVPRKRLEIKPKVEVPAPAPPKTNSKLSAAQQKVLAHWKARHEARSTPPSPAPPEKKAPPAPPPMP